MLAHREFLEAVAERAGLDRADAAKRPAESVLVCVARRLDDTGRKALESTLPTQLATLVRESTPLRRGEDKTLFLQTFRVWTHARGVVTDLDIELARRISEIIENG